MNNQDPYRIYLPEEKIPEKWLNLRGFMKDKPDPMLHPGTLQPVTAADLAPVFCNIPVEQELDDSSEYIAIPDEIREFYKIFRPSPLCRAYNLEKALGTPAKIYYKFEGNNTSGSHKLNAAAAAAFYAKQQGLTGLITETGAGQWGTALAVACGYYGLDLTVYMVKGSFLQKPYRKAVIETFGAKIIPSPSDTTNAGRKILAEHPDTSGSLGCAISEAIEVAVGNPQTRYVLGSVLNHILLQQSVIGLESKEALAMVDVYPDIVIGCAGGGSNFGGLIAPFAADKLQGKANPYFIAVEPASCPSMTRGRYAYDFGDTGMITPLVKMYTLGCEFLPSPNHAGGLRYHGMAPLLSKLWHDRVIDEAVSVEQTKVFEAAQTFAKYETILPAPESAHAIWAAIKKAEKCKQTGEQKSILFGLTGTGYFDMTAYSDFLAGTMTDHIPTDEELQYGFDRLPKIG